MILIIKRGRDLRLSAKSKFETFCAGQRVKNRQNSAPASGKAIQAQNFEFEKFFGLRPLY
jgi:hypothetical protein